MDHVNVPTYAVGDRIYRRNVPEDFVMPTVKERAKLESPKNDLYDDDYDLDDDGGYRFEAAIDRFGDEEDYDTLPKQMPEDELTDGSTTSPVKSSELQPNPYGISFNKKKRAYIAEIFVPEQLLGRVIGAKGNTKLKLEGDTGSKIEIPRRGVTGPVIIAAPKRESVEQCYDRINSIVMDGRKSLPYTHFIMVPLNHEAYVAKHEKFVDDIRASSGIHESCKDPILYMASSKLHLTITPLWLFSDKDVERCHQELKKAIVDFKTLEKMSISVRGLSHFGDGASTAARVVYAKVHSERLQTLADHLCKSMVKAGFCLEPKEGAVTLHMTILNTRYLDAGAVEKRDKGFGGPKHSVVNAEALIKLFDSKIAYGKAIVDKIQICVMGETNANTGGYVVAKSVEL